MKRAKRFFINGLILASTTVFLRGASLIFNMYITKRIGAEGMGLFGLIMSVYMLANTVATSGANFAATRLVTEEVTAGHTLGVKKALRVCLGYTLCFGTLAGALLFFFAPQIGAHWLCDVRAVRPLCCLSVSLPFVAMSSAMNGFFMAVRRVAKSASAQVFELCVKVAVTVLCFYFLADRGTEFACIAIVIGGSVSEICSFTYLAFLYKGETRKLSGNREGEKRYLPRLLSVSLPIAVSSYLRSGLVTLEHLLVPSGLKKYGASASASLAQYGVVHGMVLPFLLFPASALGAFSGLLVPELTEFQSRNNKRQIQRIARRALHKTLLFSIGAAGLFLGFGYDLGKTFYNSGDAGLFICTLAPLVVVMYTDGVVDSMLKGLGQQVHSMSYNIIDSAVSVVLIYTLLPRFGVSGYVAAIFVTELLNAFLSLNRMIRVSGCRLNLGRCFFLPCGAMTLAVTVMRFVRQHLSGGGALWVCLLGTGGIYLLLLALLGVCKDE